MIFLLIIVAGWFALEKMGREEMPDFTFDRVRVSVQYPGATASEVEHFVVRPMEEVLKALDDIAEIRSTASFGSASISLMVQGDKDDFDKRVSEIRAAVADVPLPEDITELPEIRVFQSSKKAIIDIGIYDTTQHLLNFENRHRLQQIAIHLENRLVQLPQIHSVNRNGFLREQLQVLAHPSKLGYYQMSLTALANEISSQHQRTPAGSMKDALESKVTLSGELDTPTKLQQAIIQGGFAGSLVRLKHVADVSQNFEFELSIQKVNGYEAVMLSAVKTPHAGILRAVDTVKAEVLQFIQEQLMGTNNANVVVQLLDDESRDVRNRLHLVSTNGTVGLVLIVVFLFLFLSVTSGIWVAMGIPFCFAFTAIGAYLLGYTINNMTLAAVILVMGMVVDDAIVVAENIQRLMDKGMDARTAAVEGSRFVSTPVIAAVITTCFAFIPMLFFEDRFGQLIQVIPVIVSLMLIASLLESLIILPGHMSLGRKARSTKNHWFHKIENAYGWFLERTLWTRWFWFIGFGIMLWAALSVLNANMSFVLFPNEESTQFRVNLEAPQGTNRTQMAELSRKVESIFMRRHGKELVGLRTQIARSGRGRAAQENVASLRVEVVPRDERQLSLKQMMDEWQKSLDSLEGFTSIRMSTARWGQEDGAAIEIQVLDDNDKRRKALSDSLVQRLNAMPDITEAEADRPPTHPEFYMQPIADQLRRLSVSSANIGQTLRSILQGRRLYELVGEYDDIQVVLTVPDSIKQNLEQILQIPVENRSGFLVPLYKLVQVTPTRTPASLERIHSRRLTTVYGSLSPDANLTPLQAADYLEQNVFPALKKQFPQAMLVFGGEIADSRASQGSLQIAVIAVILLIYMVLVLLFNHLFKPFLVLAIIPFAVAGVVFTFYAHGMSQYGLFASIGILGLIGVIVNDSIIMVVKLEQVRNDSKQGTRTQIVAKAAKTRLRAVILTTLTTVAGLFPTAYGIAGYDSMLAEMMLAMAWGLLFGTVLTLGLVPALYLTYWGIGDTLKSLFYTVKSLLFTNNSRDS
jgi:multidrug efflux pump subunit AcrB